MRLIRRTSIDLNPYQTFRSTLYLAVSAICCWGISHATAAAQSPAGQAQITKVTAGVKFYRFTQGQLILASFKKDDHLQLGDEIQTGNGRVVLALGDGSQVTIYERSHVKLMDFYPGASWRDLLKVVVGRVHLTINHYGKRPNPYRVYSSIASIAVRGTEFLVIVEPNGETRVLVFEGLVEVSSLVNPQKSALVKPGRSIIVRPDGDMSLVTAAPRGELNEIRSLKVGSSLDNNLNQAYNTHQENFINMRPSRFTAFNDSHLDSLQNPAYAGEFRQPNGRFYLIPSFSPEINTLYSYNRETDQTRPTSISSSNYTLSSQLSYFAPIGQRMVVGGGIATTKTDLGGTQTDGPYSAQYLRDRLAYDLKYHYSLPPDPPGGRHLPEVGSFTSDTIGKAKFTTTDLALMIARRFGQAERTSLGVKFDYQDDHSSYTLDSSWSTRTDFKQEKSLLPGRRIGFTAGLTHNFGDDKKLGIYYRHNTASSVNRLHRTEYYEITELKTFFDHLGDLEFSDSRSGRVSEVGARFRGSVTRRLFYGLEGSFLDEHRQLKYQDVLILPSGEAGYETQHTRTESAMLGGGLGYALRRRTVLGVDLSVGGTRENYWTVHQNPLSVIISDSFHKGRSTFWALNFGGQTDLRWNLFVGASRLILRDRGKTDYWAIFEGDTFFSSSSTIYDNSKLTNLSLGWRMKPGWIVQYTYFTNHGPNAPSHTLTFRYEFGRGKEK